jgi:hypothetical protein
MTPTNSKQALDPSTLEAVTGGAPSPLPEDWLPFPETPALPSIPDEEF